MKENQVITDIEQLTPEWLTSVFKRKGYLSQGKVTKVIKRNSQETVTSNVHFLELKLSNDAKPVPASPELVVKIPKPFNLVRIVAKHEAKFYSIVGETTNEMPIPSCYDAIFSEETGLSHIILEDLSKMYIELTNEVSHHPPNRYYEKAVDCLAELHAFWWDHRKLKELVRHAYVLYTFKENSFNEDDIFSWFNAQKRTLKRFSKRLGDRISDRRKEFFETVFSLFPQLAYERIKKKNITLINADAHFWNFFYPKDINNEKSKAILFDWQSWGIGVGCQDLAFMIGLFWYPETRHWMEKDLVTRYHTDLMKFGVNDYSWEKCWYDYKLGAFLNLYRVVWWWSIGWPPVLWEHALEKSMLTLEDLECMELLEKN